MSQLARGRLLLATIRDMPDQARGPAYLLYERVMREMALRGWTKIELARHADVARSSVDKLATQPRPPQAATVNKLADVLGIPRPEALELAGILTARAAAAVPEPSVSAHGVVSQPSEADPRPQLVAEYWHNSHVRVIWGLPASEEGRLRLIRELLGLPQDAGREADG